jgi:hypothetical protein
MIGKLEYTQVGFSLFGEQQSINTAQLWYNFELILSIYRFPKSPSVHINSEDDSEFQTINEFDNPVYDSRMETLVNMKPIAIDPIPSILPGNDSSLHDDEHQTATQAQKSQPPVKPKPILPKQHEGQATAAALGKNSESTANSTPLLPRCPSTSDNPFEPLSESLKPVPTISPIFPRHLEKQTTATSGKNKEPAAKTTPILPRYPSHENSLDQITPAEILKAANKRKSKLPKDTNDDISTAQSSKPEGKTTPLLPRHLRDDTPLDHQKAKSADSSTKAKPLLPKHPNKISENQTVAKEENSKATVAKPKPLLPRHPNNDDPKHQSAKPIENSKSTTKVKPLLPKHLKNDNSEDQAVPQAEKSKATTKLKPLLPKHLNTDSQTSRSSGNSNPAIKTKPMLPRRPSNGPIYASLCNSDNKEPITGASQDKAGETNIVWHVL